MSCPCSPISYLGSGGSPQLRKGRTDHLLLVQEVSLAGSIWNRGVNDQIFFVEIYTDNYAADEDSDLDLDDLAVVAMLLPRSLSHLLSFQQVVTVAGGRTDGGGGSVTMEAIFDSNTEQGDVVYVSGDGHVDLALADDVETATAVGIAIQDVLAGQSGQYIPVGPVTCETWTLTPGSVYYLSPTTPGGMTTTYPDTAGQFVIILGAAASTTQLNLEIHWMGEQ